MTNANQVSIALKRKMALSAVAADVVKTVVKGRTCDLTLRVCVRDTSCEDDEGCFFGEYCDDGMCVDGCRLNDAEACPRNEDGLPTACDPETRACEVQVVCCDEEQQCSYAFADECQDAVDGARVCGGNTNPCEGRCLVILTAVIGLLQHGDRSLRGWLSGRRSGLHRRTSL